MYSIYRNNAAVHEAWYREYKGYLRRYDIKMRGKAMRQTARKYNMLIAREYTAKYDA